MKSAPVLRQVERRILLLRGQNVILDFDLAELYGVETRALKQAVRRNLGRFPADFMFKLTASETETLVSQTVIPTRGKLGGAVPMAFTEEGVAMLSSVLRSRRAAQRSRRRGKYRNHAHLCATPPFDGQQPRLGAQDRS